MVSFSIFVMSVYTIQYYNPMAKREFFRKVINRDPKKSFTVHAPKYPTFSASLCKGSTLALPYVKRRRKPWLLQDISRPMLDESRQTTASRVRERRKRLAASLRHSWPPIRNITYNSNTKVVCTDEAKGMHNRSMLCDVTSRRDSS